MCSYPKFFFLLRFGRAQRVTVCMTMLVMCMLANAMFYGTSSDRVTDGIFGLGLLSFDPIDVSERLLLNVNAVDYSFVYHLFRLELD